MFGSPPDKRTVKTGAAGRPRPRTWYVHPLLHAWPSFETKTPMSVARITCDPRSVTQLTGVSGRLPVTSVKGLPGCCDTNTCPPLAREFLSMSPGGIHGRRYPPSVTYTVFG